MGIREIAKIKAFQHMGGSSTQAMKAGVFCGYDGKTPTCNCNLHDFNDHHVNCKLREVEYGYRIFHDCLDELTINN